MKAYFFQTILLATFLVIASCHKNEQPSNNRTAQQQEQHTNSRAVTAAQPLPAGKANFSIVYGNLDGAGTVWNRIANLTFNAGAGTVNETFWQWDNTQAKGKTALNIHTCTMRGHTHTATAYTPTGWIAPAGQYTGWTGTYTFNTTTGLLTINWANGHWEKWNAVTVQTGLAQLNFSSSSYGITHGRGYGSNASWSSYKTITQIPRVAYNGHYVMDALNSSTGARSTSAGWKANGINLSSYTSSANGLALHADLPVSDPEKICVSGCNPNNPYGGTIIYHLAGNNNSRSIVYYHFCVCLPVMDTFPNYTGNMHPYAAQQIINDAGELKGFVMIEQQNETLNGSFQYKILTLLR